MDPLLAIAAEYIGKADRGFNGIYHTMADPEFQSLDCELKNKIIAELTRRAKRQHEAQSYKKRTDNVRDCTSPVESNANEEWDRDCRIVEADARAALLADGCPPCYPPELPVPLPKTLPCEYYDIITFWRLHLNTTDHVLAAQHADWLTFRRWHRRHGQPTDPALAQTQTQAQARLKMWDEFRAYHERQYETIVRRRDKARVSQTQFLQMQPGKSAQHQMGMYSKFFAWMEQQREDMAEAAQVEAAARAMLTMTKP